MKTTISVYLEYCNPYLPSGHGGRHSASFSTTVNRLVTSRELQEELSITIRSVERVEFQTARYDDGGHFNVAYCYISDFEGEPRNNVFEEIRWVEPRELATLDILEGNKEIIGQLAHE